MTLEQAMNELFMLAEQVTISQINGGNQWMVVGQSKRGHWQTSLHKSLQAAVEGLIRKLNPKG